MIKPIAEKLNYSLRFVDNNTIKKSLIDPLIKNQLDGYAKIFTNSQNVSI